jgi:hypothetical protein
VQRTVSYRQAPLLFRNPGAGRFRDVTATLGAAFNRGIVGRGAAYADFDRDGDLDLLISTKNGPAYLYRDDGGNHNHWLTIRLAGTKNNRPGRCQSVPDHCGGPLRCLSTPVIDP